jgi:transglutaminase-like putative cysteine protease
LSQRPASAKLSPAESDGDPFFGIVMRIRVTHETVHRYEPAASGVIQTLRVTPRNHAAQYVLDWRIDISADCRLEPQQDAFGNIVHAFSVSGPISELRLLIEGEIETQDTAGVVNGAVERFPPSLFLRETALTSADEAIAAYAAALPQAQTEGAVAAGPLAPLHLLLARIHTDIACDTDVADTPDAVGTATAAEAFGRRHGTCRDLAHIFIAAVRTLGVPARYVSGYLRANGATASPDGDDGKHDARHCWAEAHVPDLGWVGFDPTNGVCVTDRHIRVAIGLDQLGAAPFRGAHYGGGAEAVAVNLVVAQAAWQTQG